MKSKEKLVDRGLTLSLASHKRNIVLGRRHGDSRGHAMKLRVREKRVDGGNWRGPMRSCGTDGLRAHAAQSEAGDCSKDGLSFSVPGWVACQGRGKQHERVSGKKEECRVYVKKQGVHLRRSRLGARARPLQLEPLNFVPYTLHD